VKVLHHRRRLEELGAIALFVVHDDPALVRRTLLADLEPAYPILVDGKRSAYREWGLQRAPWWRVWADPRVWGRYARLLLEGERIRGRGEDTLQLGGDFVVGRDGLLAYSRPQRRDDRPPVAELLRALAQAAE
jgi:AhpC/TSA antioxidant enzyme